jgi:hypothetical protein
MNIIEGIVDGFILTVGITPPRPEQRRFAIAFIAAALFGTVAGVVALALAAVHGLSR